MADQLSKSRQCPMSNDKFDKLRLRDLCMFLLLGFKFLLIDTENKYVSSGVAKTLVDRAQGRCHSASGELDLEPPIGAHYIYIMYVMYTPCMRLSIYPEPLFLARHLPWVSEKRISPETRSET